MSSLSAKYFFELVDKKQSASILRGSLQKDYIKCMESSQHQFMEKTCTTDQQYQLIKMVFATMKFLEIKKGN